MFQVWRKKNHERTKQLYILTIFSHSRCGMFSTQSFYAEANKLTQINWKIWKDIKSPQNIVKMNVADSAHYTATFKGLIMENISEMKKQT